MKILFLKKYFNVVLIGDDSLTITERLHYLWKSIITFAPIAFLLDAFNLWFGENKLFFSGVILFIFVNMSLGAWMHYKKKSFDWETLLKKTMIMVVAVLVTYLILEIILKVAGSNPVTEIFRTTLQVATLLYPGSKILKNIFILSEGEHPPQWVMEKIYNFQKNGDLSIFLKTKEELDELQEQGDL
jgi:hypothetical protein